MSAQRDDLHWIRNDAVPSLLAKGQLTFGPDCKPAVLRRVEAKRLSMEESFMLTACYKVDVVLAESADEGAATSVIKLVIKVWVTSIKL